MQLSGKTLYTMNIGSFELFAVQGKYWMISLIFRKDHKLHILLLTDVVINQQKSWFTDDIFAW